MFNKEIILSVPTQGVLGREEIQNNSCKITSQQGGIQIGVIKIACSFALLGFRQVISGPFVGVVLAQAVKGPCSQEPEQCGSDLIVRSASGVVNIFGLNLFFKPQCFLNISKTVNAYYDFSNVFQKSTVYARAIAILSGHFMGQAAGFLSMCKTQSVCMFQPRLFQLGHGRGDLMGPGCQHDGQHIG